LFNVIAYIMTCELVEGNTRLNQQSTEIFRLTGMTRVHDTEITSMRSTISEHAELLHSKDWSMSQAPPRDGDTSIAAGQLTPLDLGATVTVYYANRESTTGMLMGFRTHVEDNGIALEILNDTDSYTAFLVNKDQPVLVSSNRKDGEGSGG
jgi:hypothetical protein